MNFNFSVYLKLNFLDHFSGLKTSSFGKLPAVRNFEFLQNYGTVNFAFSVHLTLKFFRKVHWVGDFELFGENLGTVNFTFTVLEIELFG